MPEIEDSKSQKASSMEDIREEDAGAVKRPEELLDNIRQPHSEIYAEALARYPTDESIDKSAERKLRRKLDYRILPLLGICYFFYVSAYTSNDLNTSLLICPSTLIKPHCRMQPYSE